MTAICRPHLPLAPGYLVRAPGHSGSGTGKGLLLRSICAIAFGIRPRAFTKGGDHQELEKRLSSALTEQVVFLDNLNSSILRSETLDSALTERPAGARILGRSRMVTLNSTAFVAVAGNGLSVSGDSVRRYIVCELDARCEHPEQRPFEAGFLANVEANRAKLLAAALTIWRYGRQNTTDLVRGRPLGSYEEWAQWCRDPLVALGCCDPVERIDRIKADDPDRRQIVELFEVWHAHHGERPIKAADLAAPVRALIEPQGRGRHHIETRLTHLVGTCAGGFTLTKQDAAGGRGAYVFAVRATFGEGGESGTKTRRHHEEGAAVDGTAASNSFQTVSSPWNAPPVGETPCHDEEVALAPSPGTGLITIDVGRGRIHVDRDFDARTLERILEVLDRRR
jgi:hypothetical protein